jgi:hypothetical protein
LRLAQAEKFTRPHINRKKWGKVTHTYHSSNGGKNKREGSQSRVAWAKSESLSPKINKAKRVQGMVK